MGHRQNQNAFFGIFILLRKEENLPTTQVTSEVRRGSRAGAAYIFFGSRTLTGTKSASDASVTIIGRVTLDRLGTGVGGGHNNRGP